MGRTRAETTMINRRRETVADLYIQGWTQAQIANHLSVSQPTVCADLKAVQKQWRESSIRDFDLLRERELKKLSRLEREAWTAWERSQKPAQTAVVSTDGRSDQKTQKTVKDQIGDPRFLAEIHKCVASRRALLGLDAPERVSLTSPDGDQAYHTHVMSELMKLAEQSAGGPIVVDANFIEQTVQQQALPEPAPPQNDTHEA
jgi:hypothetical protein